MRAARAKSRGGALIVNRWDRGFGFFADRDIAGLSLHELPLPVLVLRESAVAHNLATMARWCAERGA